MINLAYVVKDEITGSRKHYNPMSTRKEIKDYNIKRGNENKKYFMKVLRNVIAAIQMK